VFTECVCVFVLAQLPLLIPKIYVWCFDYLIASADFIFSSPLSNSLRLFIRCWRQKKRRSKFVPREGRGGTGTEE